jgi:Membrane-associated phospholipid phosphatase
MKLKSLSKSMIALIANLIIFIYFAFNYNGALIQKLDAMVISFLRTIPNSLLVGVFSIFTNFASFYGIVIIFTITLLLYRRKDYAIYNVLIAVLAYYLSHNLKEYFMRARPDLMQLAPEAGYGFPSAHVLVATAFYGLIMLYVHYHGKGIMKKMLVYLLCLTIIIGVAISRIYLRVHFCSDVIAGLALGVALVSFFAIIRNLAFGINIRSRFSAEINDMFDSH